MTAPTLPIPLSMDRVADFCRRWKITELAVFGSAVRADFGPGSDIDLLVTFASDAKWSLFDFVDARDEFARMATRKVDMIERPALEKHQNPWLRHSILSEARVIYKAA